MIFYLLYRIGRCLALKAPLKVSYRTAVFLADIQYNISAKERQAVIENLKVVLNKTTADAELENIAKDTFRNFAKYLVDFFRFSRVDSGYIKNFIKVEGISNIDEALKGGKGVIMLSAHLGNWELGGFILSMIGYKTNAVVLTHQNEKINEFFIKQRALSNLKSIEIGAGLRSCYNALKNNELLALLGDRDFSNRGILTLFFGKEAMMPRGPSVLSYRTGAAIVPCFILRNPDDTFSFTFEKPIFPNAEGEEGEEGDEEIVVRLIMKKYLPVMEYYISRHPGQWHVFREFWNRNDKSNSSNTII